MLGYELDFNSCAIRDGFCKSSHTSVKDYLRDRFQKWYSSEVEKSYHQDESTTPVDLRMSIMKPLGAGWLVGAYNYIKERFVGKERL